MLIAMATAIRRQRRRRQVARPAGDDDEQDGADEQGHEIRELDGRDAGRRLALSADLQPVQVHPVLHNPRLAPGQDAIDS